MPLRHFLEGSFTGFLLWLLEGICLRVPLRDPLRDPLRAAVEGLVVKAWGDPIYTEGFGENLQSLPMR